MNRAIELLNEAYGLLGYFGNDDRARLLVRLAIGEVAELLDRLAALEGRATATANGDGRGVLIVDAQRMTPAFLAKRRRTALPGRL